MKSESLTDFMKKYVEARNKLLEQPELVSNCCSYPMPDTDIDICCNCGEHCQVIDLNKEEE